MTRIQVRPANERDADDVAKVHAISSQAAYEGLAPEGRPSLPMPKRIAFWKDAIEYGEPLVHVAVEDNKIIGFTGFDRTRDPKSKNTTGEVWALYVDAAHWDQGVGLALWDATRDGLIEEGCTEVSVWVPLANGRAIRFFELAGFKRELSTARTADHAGVKLEEIRLRRKLD